MSEPRFHFDRSIELSKYMEVVWICGWMLHSHYKFSDYLTDKHQIRVIGKGSIHRKWRGIWDKLIFTCNTAQYIKQENPDVILVYSSMFAFLIPIIAPHHKYILQLFTTNVSPSKLRNIFWDAWEKIIMLPYSKFFVQTPELIEMYRIKADACHIVTWGMKPISSKVKEFRSIELLYIGTLNFRRVHETVSGLKLFMQKHPDASVQYSIIGKGNAEHVRLLNDEIRKNSLEDIVKYYGYLPNDEIVPFFEKCNIGVSYVPITPYYTDVIVTKTVEYLLSGMVVVATDTNKNREAINDQNGVLIPDNPQGFADGLEKVYSRLTAYDSSLIMEGAKGWNVEFQIRTSIVPILKSISSK
ncbi:MAG: glycosyltransferase [Parabacteroides sp.]|nr:glycosyltransferase [Parabacteroides sp.]